MKKGLVFQFVAANIKTRSTFILSLRIEKGGRFSICRYKLKNKIVLEFVDSLHKENRKTRRFFNFHFCDELKMDPVMCRHTPVEKNDDFIRQHGRATPFSSVRNKWKADL